MQVEGRRSPGEIEPGPVRAADPEDPAAPIPHLPLIAEADDRAGQELRPSWRGWIHAAVTPIAAAAGIVLICLATTPTAKWASAVFALTSLLLFGNSALYHRFDWPVRVKRTLKRIDHANIFLLIAGTYTPVALCALAGPRGIFLLVMVWTGALLGIGFRVFWIGAPRWLYVPIYVALGWLAMMYIVPLMQFSVAMMTLVMVGGIIYTLGAVAYGIKRPNPVPGVFGFHEVFHTCTVLAYLCHWTAMLIIALQPVR